MWFKKKFHWKSLHVQQPRLYHLAAERAIRMRSEPDVLEEFPYAIRCNFGSRVADLTLRELDNEALTIFGWGYCSLLALALHDESGYPLVLFTKEYDGRIWSGHATVKLPNGLYLDIAGIHTAEDINHTYYMDVKPEIISRDRFCSTIAYQEHVSDPMSFVDELEQLIVKDFAKYLLKYYT